mgnify:CR=1 FL=1
MKQLRRTLSLDDVLLEPQYSNVRSRLDTDLRTKVTKNYELRVPIMSTNMSTVTEYDMMMVMNSIGGVGALHRFMQPYKSLQMIERASAAKLYPIIASIGVGPSEVIRARELRKKGANIILIDVAHGHSVQVMETYTAIREQNSDTDIIVGNIASKKAAVDFLALGVDGLRVGIGGGSRCLTRTVTGHGVPNLTALMDAVEARNKHYDNTGHYVPVIIDGGIKTSGDMTKALYFGADVVCIGNLLAGTEETPGEKITRDGKHFKKYFGMASKDAMDLHGKGKQGIAAEGFSELVPYKGSAKNILEELVGGIRSGLTYSGAMNISDLRKKGVPLLLSDAARYESKMR